MARKHSPRRAHFWVADHDVSDYEDDNATSTSTATTVMEQTTMVESRATGAKAVIAPRLSLGPSEKFALLPSIRAPYGYGSQYTDRSHDELDSEYDTEAGQWRFDRPPGHRFSRLVALSALGAAVYALFLVGILFRGLYRSLTDDINISLGSELDRWTRAEAEVAWTSILNNIGPPAGAKDGLVIASPSVGDIGEPNYYFTWTRDSALTVSSLLPAFLPAEYLRPWEWKDSPKLVKSHPDPLLEGLLRSYVLAQEEIQGNTNPSGDLWTGGLSEPKFQVDGRPFEEPWGRPQRDGPALRALALIPYTHWLLDRGLLTDMAFVSRHLYDPSQFKVRGGSVIKNDLEEVANSWDQPSFDLWEEVDGHHLFTDTVARRALQAGAKLAERLGDHGASHFYNAQADRIATKFSRYYEPERQHWKANIAVEGYPYSRTGLDNGILLAVIHAGARSLSDDKDELSPTHPTVLKTLHDYLLTFMDLYPVNDGVRWTEGWLVGRYSEDVYDGVGMSQANPWFICTHAVGHVLYLAQATFAKAGVIPLDPMTLPFWTDILGNDTTIPPSGAWHKTEDRAQFTTAIHALGIAAENTLNRTSQYVWRGQMSEQIDRRSGAQVGARRLTWSYASFLEMIRARGRAKRAVKGL